MRWWERRKDRLAYELERLRAAGIPFNEDQDWIRRGVFRLRVEPTVDGEKLHLFATFPDVYPYFRPEVEAPALSLRYHQHPAGKNLCLLGRSTDNWDPTCTLAWLLTVQLPRALAAARAKPGVDVADVEEHQAEPFEEYYASDAVVPAMILVQGGWALDRTITSGKLSVGLLPPPPGQARHFLRGVVLEVLTNNNVSLAKADAATRGLCGPDVLTCRWIRLKKPLPEFEPGKYFEQARALDPGANQNHPAPYRGGRLQLWGVVFDDEGQWRSGGGQDGWVFVGRHEIRQSAPPVVTPATRAAGPERYQQRRGRR